MDRSSDLGCPTLSNHEGQRETGIAPSYEFQNLEGKQPSIDGRERGQRVIGYSVAIYVEVRENLKILLKIVVVGRRGSRCPNAGRPPEMGAPPLCLCRGAGFGGGRGGGDGPFSRHFFGAAYVVFPTAPPRWIVLGVGGRAPGNGKTGALGGY